MEPQIIALELLKVFLLFCILVLTWSNHRLLLQHHEQIVEDYRKAMDKLREQEAQLTTYNARSSSHD